jgi:uncharacterized metal-binding protein YceD (DUF177 family)
MKHTENEFPRPLPVDRVPAGGSYERIAADADECAAVARRLGLPKIHALGALLKASPWREGVRISGTLEADVEQVSVISLEPFRSSLKHEFLRYFMPVHSNVPEGEEDIDLIHGGEIDMGEIVVETLALELDPYPRMPGEQFSSAGDDTQPIATSPFADLAKLKPGSN